MTHITYLPTYVACSLANLLTRLLNAQFFGHGDPVFPTSARHQIHIQFEKDDGILGIIKDSGDVDRFTRDCMKKWCPSDEYANENPSCYKNYFNTTVRNPAPRAGQSRHAAQGGVGYCGERMSQRHWFALAQRPPPKERH